jgi:hypothetical protein
VSVLTTLVTAFAVVPPPPELLLLLLLLFCVVARHCVCCVSQAPTVSVLSPLALAADAHELCWLLQERVSAVWKSAKVLPSTAKGVLELPVEVICVL